MAHPELLSFRSIDAARLVAVRHHSERGLMNSGLSSSEMVIFDDGVRAIFADNYIVRIDCDRTKTPVATPKPYQGVK